jgi:hypothetical protein
MSKLRRPDFDFDGEPTTDKNETVNSLRDHQAECVEVSRLLHAPNSWMNTIEEDSFAPLSTSRYNSIAMDRIIHNPSLVATALMNKRGIGKGSVKSTPIGSLESASGEHSLTFI